MDRKWNAYSFRRVSRLLKDAAADVRGENTEYAKGYRDALKAAKRRVNADVNGVDNRTETGAD